VLALVSLSALEWASGLVMASALEWASKSVMALVSESVMAMALVALSASEWAWVVRQAALHLRNQFQYVPGCLLSRER
jgi:deoxyinosine 3'endonuclease (endonuclease V)